MDPIKTAGAGPDESTRDRSPASASRLDAVLDEIDELLEDQQDVRDGADGPLPNKAMSLLAELRAARALRSESAPIPKHLVLVSRSFLEATPCPNKACSDGSIISTGPDPMNEPCQWCHEKSMLLNGEVPLV